MFSTADTICAPITAAGKAAVAVIRISGKDAIDSVAKHFRPAEKLLDSPSHCIIHGFFYQKQGFDIDEVLVSVFRAPHSYTGEDTTELSCHGNPNLVNRIMQVLLKRVRLAQPGEFTLRAYLNGKLDLSQAEAVNDLIHSQASKAESAALMQLQGKLSLALQGLLSRITDARLRCELAIDFSDQDLPLPDLQALHSQLCSILEDAEALEATGEQGRKIREGIKVCLCGAPNAGKSSLFNAFLQQNRAIVTPHPGTTRDYLEESVSLSGFPLILYDTAGLRDSSDETEVLGIARSYELMQQADIVLFLQDAGTFGFTEHHDLPHACTDKCLHVVSKADLLPADHVPAAGAIYCSVVSQDGLKQLYDCILKRLMLSDDILSQPLITNSRHLAALSRCITALRDATTALENQAGFEFVAFELSAASSSLEEILGIVSSDDLLSQIFSSFCIGK